MENQLRIAKLFDVSLDDLHGRTGSQPVAVQDYTRAVCAACTSCFCEVPVTGLGYPDDRGWYNPLQLPVYVPRPPGYPNAVNMIAVLAINCSMEPDGIRPGYVAYCDFAKPPDPRDAVFIKAIDGKVTVKRFIRHEGDGLLLVGWTEPDDDGFQQPYSELCPNDFIDTMASVVLVKRK